MRKAMLAALLMLLCVLSLFSESMEFSGGKTTVSMKQGSRHVVLTGGAKVSTDDVQLSADTMELYGEDYSYVLCSGNVSATDKSNGISFTSPDLFYDRALGKVSSDSWIEIQDTGNQAALSGGWFEYDMESSVMKLQLMAKIVKVTDEGLMVCRADIIEYDGEKESVSLRGNASVTWNGDVYKAAVITVDLSTDSISMFGTVSGEFND